MMIDAADMPDAVGVECEADPERGEVQRLAAEWPPCRATAMVWLPPGPVSVS